MLKKYFLLILLNFTSSVYAQTCVYDWEISSLGLKIGKTQDKVKINNNEISIQSSFIPNEFLKTFNVHPINRHIIYDEQLKFIKKQEFYYKNKQEFKITAIKEQFISEEKKYEIKHPLTIDSTSFPYIYNLSNNLGKDLPPNVNILTKNKAIYGKLIKEADYFVTSGEKWSILVYFEPKNKTPNKILIKNETQNVTAILKEKVCTNN